MSFYADPGVRSVRITSRHLPDLYDDVRAIFRRRGAYGQFKELLEGNSKLEAWYEYEDAEEKRELRAWCEDNGLEIEE